MVPYIPHDRLVVLFVISVNATCRNSEIAHIICVHTLLVKIENYTLIVIRKKVVFI